MSQCEHNNQIANFHFKSQQLNLCQTYDYSIYFQ